MERSSGQSGRWQKKTWRRFIIILITTIVVCIIALWGISQMVGGWSWTGFDGGYVKTTKTVATPGNSTTTPSVTIATEQAPPKTLWDILQLLIVPLVLVGVGLWFSQIQRRNDQEIANDDQSEQALQNYIDKVSDLLLQHHSYTLEGSDKNRVIDDGKVLEEIVRMRTLTVLPRLNPARKKYVLQLLYEANLISTRHTPRVDMENADFSGADLKEAQLNDTNLKGIIFNHAQLNEIQLSRAVLDEAKLKGADLFSATLDSIHLQNAILNEAKLRSVNLQGAQLINASFIDADLTDADLTNADLTNADLTNAIVTLEQLDKARNVSLLQRSSIYQPTRAKGKEETGTNQGRTNASPQNQPHE